jgi:hypothetical protein
MSEIIVVTANPSHARTQSGMREEFSAREAIFGDDKTDITNILGKKFCARVGVDQEEGPVLWFGTVLGVRLGRAPLTLITTVGDFSRGRGKWFFTDFHIKEGGVVEFDFVD